MNPIPDVVVFVDIGNESNSRWFFCFILCRYPCVTSFDALKQLPDFCVYLTVTGVGLR
mgnify:CR=1 FL=1